ncbi:ribosome-binding ATPase YchF-like [Hibiscus syriacus]|uniref:ribosome-binding ATPase YchF-like n=1 Tax=Hibiscus syriacus TaxID=106335 RepID=UPI0019231FCE|nr:ribosome-binding ATPase YchF-like [Hibiscus syriacus]
MQRALMDGKPARSVELNDCEKDAVKHLCLLTMKPILYVANVAEPDLAEPGSNPHVNEVMNHASELQSGIVTISGIKSMENTCRQLQLFWCLIRMTAPQATGVVHSDFEKGFIRAETVAYDDFAAAGSL